MPLPRWSVALLLAAGTAGWLLRGWPRVAHPTLWAEDGTIFLAGAYHDPFGAIVTPYAGYLHVLPRLVAALASPLPLTWLPTVYVVAAVVGTVAAAGLVLSSRMRWLLPRRWQPPLAFGLLVLLPAADEAFGNLANLIFYGGLALVLLGLCDDPVGRRGRLAELVVLVPLALSGPFAVLALPAFATRWWRMRSRHSAGAAAVVAGGAAVQCAILLAGPRVDHSQLAAVDVPRFVLHNVARVWLVGDRAAPVWTLGLTVAVVAWVGAVVVVAARLRSTAVGLGLVVLVGLGSALWAWGYWLVRPYVGQRHVLLPLAIAVLVLVAGLADRGRWARVVAGLCLLAGLGGIVRDAAIRPLPFYPIGPLADCLAAGSPGGPECRTTINPHRAPWIIVLRP
ncbi:MAG TPA: hypothetical protein VLJ59_15375 [Mycobacteriales bacterium]|nr:hypothetical protein [Mycobacteriales bacterium]